MNYYLEVLKNHYGIESSSIVQQQGGFAALAYRVEVSEKTGQPAERYFLKVYEKHLASTAVWTAYLDGYMPVLIWLDEKTALKGRIPKPVLTLEGEFKVEDEQHIYVLFEYIEGITLADQELSDKQVKELADIIAELHRYGENIQCREKLPREDFSVPFCHKLDAFLEQSQACLPDDLKQILEPHFNMLIQLNRLTLSLAGEMKKMDHTMRLCHTDVHGWNLMQNSDLILIDWEGLKLAPVEADLFIFHDQPFWSDFISAYKQIHQNFEISKKHLAFYLCRRRVEDIWEFIERINLDHLSDHSRQSTLQHLKKDLLESEEVLDLLTVPGTFSETQ